MLKQLSNSRCVTHTASRFRLLTAVKFKHAVIKSNSWTAPRSSARWMHTSTALLFLLIQSFVADFRKSFVITLMLILTLSAVLSTSASRPEFEFWSASRIARELPPLIEAAYVATDDDELRLDPPPGMLRWMLSPPGMRDELQVGIGVRGEAQLIGFVAAVPSALRLRGERHQAAVEVSLLCLRQRRRWASKWTSSSWSPASTAPSLCSARRARHTHSRTILCR